jgi:uroporphyrinogen-III synthase
MPTDSSIQTSGIISTAPNSPVSTILVSQPKPEDKNSPYYRLAEKYNLTIDFRPFIEVQAVDFKEFRYQKINILNHDAVIFTSRHAIDAFFNLCKNLKTKIPASMLYFCISEQTANYLQKHITLRKRKTYTGMRTAIDLIEVLQKHPDKKFLYPCSESPSEEIINFFKENEYQYSHAIVFETVASDLSDLTNVNYDVIAFFSPTDIKSLFINFPQFKQGHTRIAGFGPSTCKVIKDHGLTLNIEAPSSESLSMTGALDLYIKANRD